MKNEAEFKSLFKKSVKIYKGHTITLAAPMFSGIPDLWVCIPGYLPVLMEAKWLGEIKRTKFSRKIPFTPMQIEWIKNCDNVCSYSAMGLIGFKYGNDSLVHAALVKYGTPLFYNFTQDFLTDCAFVTISEKMLDIVELFSKVPIPRMQTKVEGTLLNYDLPERKMDLAS